MHISEGVLSAPVLISGAVGGAVLLGAGLRKLPWDHIMTTAMLSAGFFCASLVHFRVGLVDLHLLLNGLLGCILGLASVPAIFVALVLQALLFQFGGLTTLGVNTCIMAFPAVFTAWLFRPLLRRGLFEDAQIGQPGHSAAGDSAHGDAAQGNAAHGNAGAQGRKRVHFQMWMLGAFGCGALAVGLSATLEAAALLLSGKAFEYAALMSLLLNIPLMLLEGVITVFIVGLLRREKPDMLRFILEGDKRA